MYQRFDPGMLTDVVGYIAASLVFATFCMQRMLPLRSIAIASNLAFIGYGYLASLWPILVLHAVLLPINIQRCRQSLQGPRGAATATADAGRPMRNRSPLPYSTRSLGNWIAAALGRLRSWWERVELRHELSSMSARDFGDLRVSPSLIADQVRRWQWQGPSPQWRAAAFRWSAAQREDFVESTCKS